MRKSILLIILAFININCSQKLVTTYTKNGVEVEKINLRLLDKHFVEKYSKDSLQYSGHTQKDIFIKEIRQDTIILVTASKDNNSYSSISRNIFTNDSREFTAFYVNGNIKWKINRYLDNGKKVQVAGIETILFGLKGKQHHYDQKGRVVENLDFDLIYKYTLDDVFEFIKSDNAGTEKTYTASHYYLSKLVDEDGLNKRIVEEYYKSGIHLKFDHPYWIISSSIADQYQNIYLDGVTGEEIGRQTWTIRHAID